MKPRLKFNNQTRLVAVRGSLCVVRAHAAFSRIAMFSTPKSSISFQYRSQSHRLNLPRGFVCKAPRCPSPPVTRLSFSLIVMLAAPFRSSRVPRDVNTPGLGLLRLRRRVPASGRRRQALTSRGRRQTARGAGRRRQAPAHCAGRRREPLRGGHPRGQLPRLLRGHPRRRHSLRRHPLRRHSHPHGRRHTHWGHTPGRVPDEARTEVERSDGYEKCHQRGVFFQTARNIASRKKNKRIEANARVEDQCICGTRVYPPPHTRTHPGGMKGGIPMPGPGP